MRIEGACHCRNVVYAVEWPDEGPVPSSRACGCTFCTKHGGRWTSHPDATLVATVADPSCLSPYRFGHETADFHVCSRCGVVPFVTSDVEGRRYAVVNVNTFENVDRARIETAPADFEGEAVGDRLARRAARWIPDVRIEPA